MADTYRIVRLRYRSPEWSPNTANCVRIYARHGDALNAAERLRARGFTVELCISRRWPWLVTQPAPWTTADERGVVK